MFLQGTPLLEFNFKNWSFAPEISSFCTIMMMFEMAKIKQQHADLSLSTAQTRADSKMNPNWNQASLKASLFDTFSAKIRPVTVPERTFPPALAHPGLLHLVVLLVA